jgi:hypothetical protein
VAPLLEFDPTSEDAANSPLEIWNTASYTVTAFSAPAPPLTMQWAGSVDTEGSLPASRKHENRTLSITVDVSRCGAPEPAGEDRQGRARGRDREADAPGVERGRDLRPARGGHVRAAARHRLFRELGLVLHGEPVAARQTVRPRPRGDAQRSRRDDAAVLVFTRRGSRATCQALGTARDHNATATKTLLMWGLRSRYYDASSPLFYEAETLTASGATANAGHRRVRRRREQGHAAR